MQKYSGYQKSPSTPDIVQFLLKQNTVENQNDASPLIQVKGYQLSLSA